jgi:hypothetical protein
MARYFFDVHINDDGIAGYYVWKRNDIRIPILHPLLDLLMRNSRNGKSREEVVNGDYRNFFIPFDEVQGLVTDSEHKEIQLLYSQEQIYFYFRDKPDYERLVEVLKKNVPDRYYTRDGKETTPGVYVS